MIEIFKKYQNAGFACLPTKRNKQPLFAQRWNDGFDASAFENAEGIGIICGAISGGLECLDFDNHFGDAKKVLASYLEIPEVSEIYKKFKLPIESTQSGGFHLLFRCEKNEGNRKLAQRLNKDGRPEAIIETRGDGGYFVAAPTPGYTVIRNDISKIQTISVIERAILIDNAVSLNEHYPVIRTDYETKDRPGDLYNDNPDSIEEMKNILRGAGWSEVGHGRWRRPGKKEGISATIGKAAPGVFYVFSSNAYPFEQMKGYSPFQVLALVKYDGNFSRAAESLPKPNRITITTKGSLPELELDKILKSAQIDIKKKVEKPPTVISIMESDGGTSLTQKRLMTLGNFSCIIGKAKSKKTFFLTMLTASLLRPGNHGTKFIGHLNETKNTILYFDTEQGDYDCHNTIARIYRMSGNLNSFYGFSLRQYSPIERCQIIEYAFKKLGDYTAFCVIDGIADLAVGINEEEEATRVTTMLLRLTKVYNCHISTVIHQNKNDNFATGHLGSAIMKKAEIIISVTRDHSNNSYSEVNCDMSRGIDFNSFSFYINSEGIPEISSNSTKEELVTDWYEQRTESESFAAPF